MDFEGGKACIAPNDCLMSGVADGESEVSSTRGASAETKWCREVRFIEYKLV